MLPMSTTPQPLSLDGDWRLYHFPKGDPQVSHPDELAARGLPHLPARVPGNVELDLQRAGALPEPFYADNMRLLRDLEDHEWWLLREFELPTGAAGRDWDLVFEGLDTFATVWVNGAEVGRADNMFIEHRFDVSGALKPGAPNRIAVRLAPAVLAARAYDYEASIMSWESRHEGLFIRKAPHVWGWDIMPRAVSAGIWRPVRLEERPAAAIEHVYYWTAGIDEGGGGGAPLSARLGAQFQFRTPERDLSGFSMHFSGRCGEHTFEFDYPVEFVADLCHIRVPDAKLWWPKGYGKPDLYTVTASLCRDGQVLAERTDRIGIRTVEVDRTEQSGPAWRAPTPSDGPSRLDIPPEPDSHFLFRVNGVPVQVRGSNWVPLDAFHSRDAGRLKQALDLFDDLGCTMIRCWGGNVYEDHAFFDLCDERGMLVWQDLAFACCLYPQTEEFFARVRTEVASVARKLRNHASLAIWCGDNENDMLCLSEGLSPSMDRLSREVIPQVLFCNDPHRHYVPSSPYVPPSVEGLPEAWQRTPEQHMWGPRGYYKAPFYTEHNANFIGEIGYHGCPNVSSVKRFVSRQALWPWQDNEEWLAHSVSHWRTVGRRSYRVALMANQIRALFGEVPDELGPYAVASQITQAEAKKFFIESTRLRKWHTSGILWWNVLDGWPQFSDAIVDYYFGKKLAYHYIRRSQQPVCLVMGEPQAGRASVVACNDTRDDAAVAYRVWELGGSTLAEGGCEVPAGQNWQLAGVPVPDGAQRLYLMEWHVGDRRFGNHYAAGAAPLSLAEYLEWLPAIAALERPFDAGEVGR
jgi:beta-mannosidase